MAQKNLTTRQNARARRRQRWTLRPDGPALPLSTRVYTPGNSVTGFPYDRIVATGEVNRDEWAKIIRTVWAENTPDGKNPKKAPFARLIGVDTTTLDNWLGCEVDVKESSVRQVATRTGHNAMGWLIGVGFYQIDDLPVRLPNEVIDEEQRAVLDDPTLSDDAKADILRELETWREEDEQALAGLRERDKRRRMERLSARVDKARQDEHQNS